MQQSDRKKKKKGKTFRVSWGDGLWCDVEGASGTDVRDRLWGLVGGASSPGLFDSVRVKKVKPWMSSL